MFSIQLLSMICLLIVPAFTLPTADSSSAPLPPSRDPWYKAPDGYVSKPPGSILRMRSAPGNLTTKFNASEAFNVLFRSTDSRYQPSWAVTTILVPKSTDGQALLSYQIPYNSADVDSSPSYLLYSITASGLNGLILHDITTALNKGWYVNIPDHEGPLASFAASVTEGHNVLDSVRAALDTDCGVSRDAKYAMWGYSGGSIASEFAAELQVQYAPELKFAGAALGGVVSNFTSVFSAVDGTPFAGLLPEGLLGITTQYAEAYEYLLSQLKTSGPYNKTGFLAAKDMSIEEAFVVYANQTIWDYFKDGEDILKAPAIQNMFNQEAYMGYHGTPQMPLLMYKAINDEVTPIDSTDALADRYCIVGVNIIYERNKIGGHVAEETNGDERALEWLSQVLSDTYDHTGCTIKDVVLNVTDSPM